MRVPDLNWPVDLFTDVIMLPSETIVVLSAEPNLWTEMVDSWIENGAASDARWPIPMFEAEHSSWPCLTGPSLSPSC